MEERKPKRVFTPEQKFEMLKDIGTFRTIKEGLEKYQLSHSVHRKWKRQLEVGVRASLCSSKPLKLAAPTLQGRIAFVSTEGVRRSLGAVLEPTLIQFSFVNHQSLWSEYSRACG